VPVDRCDECHFDGGRWTDQDVLTTLGVLAELWDGHLDGAGERVLHVRPDAETWSIAEYTQHLPDTLWAMRFLAELAATAPGTDLGHVERPTFDAEPAMVDLEAARARLREESALLAGALAAVPPEEWPARTVGFSGDVVDLGWIGRHALHDATHHLHDVGRIRVALGDGVAHQHGTVSHLAVSAGGVPKQGVDRLEVDWSGAVGDRQGDRRHHGRPFQALCLWSSDVIAALQSEGHPIEAGFAGENITAAGVEWSTLRPGTIVRIGGVVGEISSHATPCSKNAAWFHDRGFRRIDQDDHPGWSRLYAAVLEPGAVAVGDAFVVEPDRPTNAG
jgi:MOSC domain-containing protein YiiM